MIFVFLCGFGLASVSANCGQTQENSQWMATRPLKKIRLTSLLFDLLVSIRTDWILCTRTRLNIGCNVRRRQTSQIPMKCLSYATSFVQKHVELRLLVPFLILQIGNSAKSFVYMCYFGMKFLMLFLTYIKFSLTAFPFPLKTAVMTILLLILIIKPPLCTNFSNLFLE